MAELTARETEVARMCAQGFTSKEIGRTLLLAPRTVEHHLEHAKHKLGAKNCAHFVTLLYENGVLEVAEVAEEAEEAA
jgi:DNA-binding CsgD family transcriptional regulator